MPAPSTLSAKTVAAKAVLISFSASSRSPPAVKFVKRQDAACQRVEQQDRAEHQPEAAGKLENEDHQTVQHRHAGALDAVIAESDHPAVSRAEAIRTLVAKALRRG